MKKFLVAMSFISVSAMASPVEFTSCTSYPNPTGKAFEHDLSKLAVDTQVREVLGDLGGCPRQILMTEAGLVYQLADVTKYACGYQSVRQSVGFPEISCFGRRTNPGL